MGQCARDAPHDRSLSSRSWGTRRRWGSQSVPDAIALVPPTVLVRETYHCGTAFITNGVRDRVKVEV
jgi:hypothetical protein